MRPTASGTMTDLAFFPYSLLALVLGSILFLADRASIWILLPYLGYLVYALWWSRRVWQLNRAETSREGA